MLAPKTGKQMRKDLRKRYDDARDTLQDWSEEAIDRVNDLADRSGDSGADELGGIWPEKKPRPSRRRSSGIRESGFGLHVVVLGFVKNKVRVLLRVWSLSFPQDLSPRPDFLLVKDRGEESLPFRKIRDVLFRTGVSEPRPSVAEPVRGSWR